MTRPAPTIKDAIPTDFAAMLNQAQAAGRIARQTPVKKLAILGYAPSVAAAPFTDPSFHFWGMNDMMDVMPRIDMLFEMHEEYVVRGEGHWDRLKLLDCPIVMWQAHPEIPAAVSYPYANVADRFLLPTRELVYLNCTAAEMFALALLLDPLPEEIHVFGTDMSREEEFAWQRPSIEFYIGYAHAKGVKVFLQRESDICLTNVLYGHPVQEPVRTGIKFRLQQRVAYLKGEEERHMGIIRDAQLANHEYHAAAMAIEEVLKMVVDV